MARIKSPKYPSVSLEDAIDQVRKVYEADRKNVLSREVIASHIGYSSLSGAADKAISNLMQYGLLERVGKGQVRVSQIGEDIVEPEYGKPERRTAALLEAAFSPTLFAELKSAFPDGASEVAVRSHLVRGGFHDRAIKPAVNSYLQNCSLIEREAASESGGNVSGEEAESDVPSEGDAKFGGASVGDLVQWESGGVLKLTQPARVHAIHESGDWVFVEGSQTGIPMSEVIVKQAAAASTPPLAPPVLPMQANPPPGAPALVSEPAHNEREKEWVRTPLGKGAHARILVTDDLSDDQIEKLRSVLQAMKENDAHAKQTEPSN